MHARFGHYVALGGTREFLDEGCSVGHDTRCVGLRGRGLDLRHVTRMIQKGFIERRHFIVRSISADIRSSEILGYLNQGLRKF